MNLKKKEIESINDEAIEKLNNKKGAESRVTQNQSGDIFNITHAGDGDINMSDETKNHKMEIKYLKKLIQSKDEEIELLKDALKECRNSV